MIGIVLRFGTRRRSARVGRHVRGDAAVGRLLSGDALPAVLQPIALALPTTHAFTALRALVDGGGLDWGQLGIAAASALILAGLSLWFLVRMLRCSVGAATSRADS